MKSSQPEHVDAFSNERRSTVRRDDDRERNDRYQQAIEILENDELITDGSVDR